jgi:SOS-response transcriptional repressor LexA
MALAGNPADYFALNVVGYSMVEVGVNEGDLVIVRRTTEPVWGNIMLVSYLGGLSLKWAVRYGGAACLRCGNGLRVDICNYQIEGELEWGIKRYKWG